MRVFPVANPIIGAAVTLNLYLSRVPAGFPSPADDYVERELDLNEYLIKHPAATVLVKAQGSSMQDRGIYSGDILVVDRALRPAHGNIVIAAINGELTCKIFDERKRALVAANNNFPPIRLIGDMELIIEGVVVHSIRDHLSCSL
jgi:DNA polymerase V